MPTTTTTMRIQTKQKHPKKMLTYGCRNVTQDNAAVSGGVGGGGGFGQPASETNESQPPNTNDDGSNVSRTLLLGRVANMATTQSGGPALGGLAPANPCLSMVTVGFQATEQGNIESVTLISALTKNMGVPTTTTQGVQLPPTPPMQPVQ